MQREAAKYNLFTLTEGFCEMSLIQSQWDSLNHLLHEICHHWKQNLNSQTFQSCSGTRMNKIFLWCKLKMVPAKMRIAKFRVCFQKDLRQAFEIFNFQHAFLVHFRNWLFLATEGKQLIKSCVIPYVGFRWYIQKYKGTAIRGVPSVNNV